MKNITEIGGKCKRFRGQESGIRGQEKKEARKRGRAEERKKIEGKKVRKNKEKRKKNRMMNDEARGGGTLLENLNPKIRGAGT